MITQVGAGAANPSFAVSWLFYHTTWWRHQMETFSTLLSPFLGQFTGHRRWRHQMETFSASLAICAGNSPVPGEFPTQRPVTRSFGVFFDLRLNKWLSKQWCGWWFETPSCPLWRHCNEIGQINIMGTKRQMMFSCNSWQYWIGWWWSGHILIEEISS